MKPIITTLLILTCVVALVGCKDKTDSAKDIQKTKPNVSDSNVPEPDQPEPNEPPSSDIPTTPPADTFEIQGTITYKNIEGGFFAIDGDDGSKYDPINLPDSFRKDGMKVKVTARLRRDATSIHMYGAIVEVVNIAAR
jgi:hypothetical protein